ncbi:MAG: excinuclease ABC subunit UvrC [Candidatus Nanopelagicaceae bacterium]|nr:excinuclease ABC subunit UvrC [Candidatus Nanopelagicaceae bacterium]
MPANFRPENIPTEPGVYRFFDKDDRVLYVGKAINLKNRLTSYFLSGLAERTDRMVSEAVRCDWTIVSGEVEALQLEYTWIKQFKPPFNVRFRDDKSYPYLALSINDKYPRLFITRQEKRKGIKYYGPYIQAWALRTTHDTLLKVFPVRSCTSGNFERAKLTKRQCLLGDIGKCSAPCVGWVSEVEHKELAQKLDKFLSSGNTDLVAILEREMAEAAANEEFERAARLRDQVNALNTAQESNDAALSETINADVISLYTEGLHTAASIFKIRAGSIRGSRSWILNQNEILEGEDELTPFIVSIYSEEEIPAELIINRQVDQGLSQFLSELRGAKVEIRVPQRGEKLELSQTVERNARYSLIQYLSKRANDAAVSGKALTQIQEALALDGAPLRIECFDISNTSGTTVVASMVVFEDGQIKKSDYRRFIIETGTANDDTRAMHQVISRRMKRWISDQNVEIGEVAGKFAYAPNLIVVDGGAPQVAAAERALLELGITDIAVVGLAKRLEEIWLPGNPDPIILPRNSEGLYLLQRIRDEAHRFAITFHRSRRSKIMLESLLDEIDDLGPTRRAALLDRFGSVSAIRKATVDEIAKTPGIGERLAQAISAHLAQQPVSIDMETGEIKDA